MANCPAVYFFCEPGVRVEPLREFEPQLKKLTDRLGGTYRIAAANDTGEPVSFNVHTDHLHGYRRGRFAARCAGASGG